MNPALRHCASTDQLTCVTFEAFFGASAFQQRSENESGAARTELVADAVDESRNERPEVSGRDKATHDDCDVTRRDGVRRSVRRGTRRRHRLKKRTHWSLYSVV